MRLLTKEELKELEPAVEYFDTIRCCQYKRNSPYAVNKLVADMLDNVTGKLNNRNFGCGNCIYNLFKDLMMIYDRSKEDVTGKTGKGKSTKSTTNNKK